MHDWNVLRRLAKHVGVFCVGLCAFYLHPVAAQSVTGDGRVYPLSTIVHGNATTFERFVVDLHKAGSMGASVSTNGSIATTHNTRLPNGTAVTVAGRIAKENVGAVIGRSLVRLSGLGAALTLGMGLYDLVTERGFAVDTSGGGQPVVTRGTVSHTYNCSDPCYGATPEAAAVYFNGLYGSGHPYVPFIIGQAGPGYGGGYQAKRFVCAAVDAPCDETKPRVADYTITSTTTGSEPATLQELIDDIASESGWPSSSALARATVQAIKTGDAVPVDPETVTGPPSSPPVVKTSTKPDGTVTTTTATTNHTYNDNRVTNNTTTVVTVYNPSTGDTTTEQTDDAPTPEPQKDHCEQHPESAGCARLDVPEADIPSKTVTVDYSVEDTGLGDGSCPAPFPFSTSNGSYEIDLSPYCDAMTDWVKPVFLAVCAFAAFMLAFPRGSS